MINDLSGIWVNGKHTYQDWMLAACDPLIPVQPEVNEYLVDLPGANGFLDLSEALLNEPSYQMRDGTFEFLYVGKRENLATVISDISSTLHGKNLKIISDEDPDYYYKGLLKLSDFRTSKNKTKIKIDYELDPYKYSNTETELSITIPTTDSTKYWTQAGWQYSDVDSPEVIDENPSGWDISSAWIPTQSKTFNINNMSGIWFEIKVNGPIYIEFVDVNENSKYFALDIDSSWWNDGKTHKLTYSIESIINGWVDREGGTSGAIDPTKIVMIICRNSYHFELWWYLMSNALYLDGGDKSVMPAVKASTSGLSVSIDGKLTSLSSGEHYYEKIVIPRTGQAGTGASSETAGTAAQIIGTSGTVTFRYTIPRL